MEDRAFLPISSVPSFAQGLKILLKYRTEELINQQACISGFTPRAAFSNFDGRSQSSSGYPGFPISITALSGSQNQNQCLYEFPTAAMSNYGSQNLEAEMEQQPIADASVDQINYGAMRSAHYDTTKMLAEDCEELHYSQNGVLPHQIDQYYHKVWLQSQPSKLKHSQSSSI
ncbi:hypothetical protein K1719_008757 [Acacia pycnantha]|nr:hypothetical protein K1719_008757 [Acacia pycnantha]